MSQHLTLTTDDTDLIDQCLSSGCNSLLFSRQFSDAFGSPLALSRGIASSETKTIEKEALVASIAKDKKPALLPAPNSDFYGLIETLPAEELTFRKQVRAFMETKVAPIITRIIGAL